MFATRKKKLTLTMSECVKGERDENGEPEVRAGGGKENVPFFPDHPLSSPVSNVFPPSPPPFHLRVEECIRFLYSFSRFLSLLDSFLFLLRDVNEDFCFEANTECMCVCVFSSRFLLYVPSISMCTPSLHRLGRCFFFFFFRCLSGGEENGEGRS